MMRIDLSNGDVFTDTGKFLKRLHCPKAAAWDKMAAAALPDARECGECSHLVYDTAGMTDEALERLLAHHPNACLKISLTQTNCTVLPAIS
jgi:hypothetical protein